MIGSKATLIRRLLLAVAAYHQVPIFGRLRPVMSDLQAVYSRDILMNHFVICVIDFIVKLLMVLAVVFGVIIAFGAVAEGTPAMALVALMPVGGVVAGCGFWCVLSGIYHNTRVKPRPVFNRDVEPTFED